MSQSLVPRLLKAQHRVLKVVIAILRGALVLLLY